MKLYTVPEAAEILRKNPEVIRRMARTGRLTGSKNGKSWLFMEEDFVKFIKAGRDDGRERSHG